MNTKYEVSGTLTAEESKWAIDTAAARRFESQSHGRKNSHGMPPKYDTVENDNQGAKAELFAANVIGIEWGATVNSFKGADLGSNIQVKSSKNPNSCLIFRCDDNPKHNYVLVTCAGDVFTIVGWIPGVEAKKDCWYTNAQCPSRPKQYFVPQSALLDIKTIPH